jgi:hypothetical protein
MCHYSGTVILHVYQSLTRRFLFCNFNFENYVDIIFYFSQKKIDVVHVVIYVARMWFQDLDVARMWFQNVSVTTAINTDLAHGAT